MRALGTGVEVYRSMAKPGGKAIESSGKSRVVCAEQDNSAHSKHSNEAFSQVMLLFVCCSRPDDGDSGALSPNVLIRSKSANCRAGMRRLRGNNRHASRTDDVT